MLLAFIAAAPAMAAQVSSSDGPGEETGLTNTVCPVMPDEAVDPSFFLDHDGSRVYFCCRRCVLRFEQNPEAYAESLAKVMPVAVLDSPSLAGAAGHDHEHHEGSDVAGESHADDHDSADDGLGHEHDGGSAEEGHDHATDHGVSPTAMLGRFHVVVIHFPIAFLLLGALVEAAGFVRKQWGNQDVVRLLTAVGALSAVVAMVLGLLHGSASDYAGTLSWVFWWHRALGIAVAVTALIAWFAVERRARRNETSRFATAALLVSAALVGAAGHFGGSLVYGWEYLLP
ncbi:MAG: DUF2231 domain-containing protein [Planctomycetota bacterium]